MSKIRINNSDYSYTVEIKPTWIGLRGKYKLGKDSLIQMDIIEDMRSPWVTATMSIKDPYLYGESSGLMGTLDGASVEIELTSSKTPDKFKYKFAIVNETSTAMDDPINNIKHYILVDYTYYKLMDTNQLPGNFLNGVVARNNNVGIKYYVGSDVIKQILIVGHMNIHSDWDKGLLRGFDETLPYNIDFVRHSNYLSPSEHILKIIRNDYISDGIVISRPLLTQVRENNGDISFTYKPLHWYFQNWKSLLKEGFIIDTPEIDYSTASNKYNPPEDVKINMNKYHSTLKYVSLISPLGSASLNKFVDKCCVSTNPLNNRVITKLAHITDVVDDWAKVFVDKFTSAVGALVRNAPMSPPGYIVKEKLSSTIVDIDNLVKVSKAGTTNSLVFDNLTLRFSVVGNITRKPGTFINIYKHGESKNEVDKKLLGTWLVTAVSHSFKGNEYNNEFHCNKTYTTS